MKAERKQRKLVAAFLVFLLTVSLFACGTQQPQTSETPETPPAVEESEAAANLRGELLKEGEATITLEEEIQVEQGFEVRGNKTIIGGTLLMNTAGETMFQLTENSSLTIDGTDVNAMVEAEYILKVPAGSSFTLLSGRLQNASRNIVDLSGTAYVRGGEFLYPSGNWLTMHKGANAEITGGFFSYAGGVGIVLENGAELNISGDAKFDGSGSNIIFNRGSAVLEGGTLANSGDYAIANVGELVVKGTTDIGNSAARGLIYTYEIGSTLIDGVELHHAAGSSIYNKGHTVIRNTRIVKSSGSAVSNQLGGVLEMSDSVVENCYGNGVLNNDSTAELKNVSFINVAKKSIDNMKGTLTGEGITINGSGEVAILNTNNEEGVEEYGTLTLSNFEITGAKAVGVTSYGGELELSNGVINLSGSSNLYVRGGTASIASVDMYGTDTEGSSCVVVGSATHTGAVVTLKDALISGASRGVNNYAEIRMEDCRVEDNHGIGEMKFGGGVSNNGTMMVVNTDIVNNSAIKAAGGVYNTGVFTMEGGTIAGNLAETGAGGGIANIDGAKITLTNVTITGNTAHSTGGGVYNEGAADLTGCRVSENTSGSYGAGIYTAREMSLSDVTATGNTAKWYDLCSTAASTDKTVPVLSIGGTMNVGSFYRGTDTELHLTGAVSAKTPIRLYLSTSDTSHRYCHGARVLDGSKNNIKQSISAFVLPEKVRENYAIGTDGLLYGLNEASEKNRQETGEAKLYDSKGNLKSTGLLRNLISEAEDGDKIVLQGDVTLSRQLVINKDLTITDDGKTRTIRSTCTEYNAVLIAGTAEKPIAVKFVGTETGGLILDGGMADGKEQVRERPFAAVTNAAFQTKNVTFRNCRNIGVETGGESSRKNELANNGGALRIAVNASYAAEDTRFENCESPTSGGAIYSKGPMELTRVIIDGCRAASYGGGIYTDGDLTMTDCALSNCEAKNGGAVAATQKTGIAGGSLCENTAENYGGAVYLAGSAEMTISGTTIENNRAKYGGAIYINKSTTGTAKLSVENAVLRGNKAGDTGGVFYNKGELSLSNCDIRENAAEKVGGVMYSSGQAQIRTSTITGNKAPSAGAIYNSAAGVLELEQTTVKDNGSIDIISNGVLNQKKDVEIGLVGSTVGSSSGSSADSAHGSGTVVRYAADGVTVKGRGTLFDELQAAADGDILVLTSDASFGNWVPTITKSVTIKDDGTVRHIYSDVGTATSTNFIKLNKEENGENPTIRFQGTSAGGLIIDGENKERSRPAISVLNCTLYMENVTIRNMNNVGFTKNDANNYGGAIRIAGGTVAGTAHLTNVTIENCVSVNGGGAVYNNGTLTVEGGVFSGNKAATSGGAFYNSGNLTVSGAEIKGNTAANYGGGVYSTKSAELTDTLITGNTATAKAGGGICTNSTGALTLSGVTVSGNTAGTDGAGMNLGGTTEMTDTVFNSNGTENDDVYVSGTITMSGKQDGGFLRLKSGKVIKLAGAMQAGASKTTLVLGAYEAGTAVLTGDVEVLALANDWFAPGESGWSIGADGALTAKPYTVTYAEDSVLRDAVPAEAKPGEDYVISVKDFTGYDAASCVYTVSYSVGTGEYKAAADNGDGTFTIPGGEITGKITVRVSAEERKQYCTVTLSGTDVSFADDTVQQIESGTSYECAFATAADAWYVYSYQVGAGQVISGVILGNGGDASFTIPAVNADTSVTVVKQSESAVAYVDTTFYDDFDAAVAAAEAIAETRDVTVTLIADISLSAQCPIGAAENTITVTAHGGDRTIDVSEMTDTSVYALQINGKVVFKGGDAGEKLTITGKNAERSSAAIGIVSSGDGELTLGENVFITQMNNTTTTGWNKNLKDSGSGQYGGAVIIHAGKLTVSGASLTNNAATTSGGAIYVNGGTLTIGSGSFTENSAKTGGAVYITNSTSVVSVGGGTFRMNTATAEGGAVYVGNGTVTIEGGVYEENTAKNGGAIYAGVVGTYGGGTFTNNRATGTAASNGGGAIYLNKANASYTGGIFSGNVADSGYGSDLFGGNVCAFTTPVVAGESLTIRNWAAANSTYPITFRGVAGKVYSIKYQIDGAEEVTVSGEDISYDENTGIYSYEVTVTAQKKIYITIEAADAPAADEESGEEKEILQNASADETQTAE